MLGSGPIGASPGREYARSGFYGPRDLRLESVPEPEPGPGDVKLRVIYNGICGSDLHEYYDGPITTRTTPHPLTGVKNPVILGHELCGEVVSCGARGRGLVARRADCRRAARNLRPLRLVHGGAVQPLSRFGAARLQPSVAGSRNIPWCAVRMAHRLAAGMTPAARRGDRAARRCLAHRQSMPAGGRADRGHPRRGTHRHRCVPDSEGARGSASS